MSLANQLPLFREKYHSLKDVVFDTSEIDPILACFRAKADDDGQGRGFIFPIKKSGKRTASATFATAQTKARGSGSGWDSQKDRWVITPATIHQFANFTREELNAARKGGAESQYNLYEEKILDAIRDVRQQLAIAAVEGGYQAIGQCSAVTATTITFDPSVVNRLDIGDTLVASATEDSSVLLATAGSTTVTAYDPDTGVATVDTDTTTGGTPATNTSFWFREGNRQDAASPVALLPFGLKAWIGSSASIGGVTRTGNPTLTGHTVNASTGALDHSHAFLKALSRLTKYCGPMQNVCFTSLEDYLILNRDKDVQKSVDIELGEYKIGFSGIGVSDGNGRYAPVLSCANLPQGTAYVGPFNTKEYAPHMKYSNDIIDIDDFDGNDFLRRDNLPEYEGRLYSETAMCIPGPGYYCKITNLPSV